MKAIVKYKEPIEGAKREMTTLRLDAYHYTHDHENYLVNLFKNLIIDIVLYLSCGIIYVGIGSFSYCWKLTLPSSLKTFLTKKLPSGSIQIKAILHIAFYLAMASFISVPFLEYS